MEKVKIRDVRRIIGLLLVMLLLSALLLPVYAGAAEAKAESRETVQSIVDEKELTRLVETFLGERGISTKNFSLGFCYTATGDTWYFNGDSWYYPASVYKVPLMMLLSEKVKSGELTQDSDIEGKPVSEVEELILTYSNNDWAHVVRSYLGGDEVWREDAKQYSSLSDADYSADYMDYCYFSNRYITEVVKTLYAEPERFPNIIECLSIAEPKHYFRLSMEGKYDIAQKYGSFCDQQGNNFNHTTGIINTPNPIIVTVMTLNVPEYEKVISDAAIMMKDYALNLDKKLSGYERQLAKAEEDKRKAEEQQAAAEQQAAMDAERAKAEAAAAAQAIAEQQALQSARKELFTKLFVLAVIAVIAVIVVSIIRKSKRRKARDERYDAYRRRYEAERRSTGRSNSSGGNGYRPRH